MEMHQIRYFLALCEKQNFTRAAKRCGVSQPSLTNAIKRLEAELGGLLFERGGRTTRLSDLGKIVRPDLAELERSAANANRAAAEFLSARTVTRQPETMEAFMRAHHVIAVVVVLVVGFGAKQFFFPPVKAEADINPSVSMNVLQMHRDTNMNNLPVQKMRDMTFVFDSD